MASKPKQKPSTSTDEAPPKITRKRLSPQQRLERINNRIKRLETIQVDVAVELKVNYERLAALEKLPDIDQQIAELQQQRQTLLKGSTSGE